MDNKDYMSIKDFAIKVGVSQQAIYKQLNNKLKKYLKVVDNKKYLHISALKEYLDIEENSTNEQQLLNLLQTTIDTLKEQLQEKDKQIANFQKQQDQEQQLRAIDKQKIIELEETKPPIKEEPEPQEDTPPDEPKKKWWNKFF